MPLDIWCCVPALDTEIAKSPNNHFYPLVIEQTRKVSVPVVCIVIKSLKELPRHLLQGESNPALRSTVRELENNVYRFPSNFEICCNPSIITQSQWKDTYSHLRFIQQKHRCTLESFESHGDRVGSVMTISPSYTRVLFWTITREIIYKYFSSNRPVVSAHGL